MTDSYCGKNCEECTWYQEQKCQGCKAGPSQRYGGNCDIAQCCWNKGHDACQSCSFAGGCRRLQGRQHEPGARIRRAEAQRQERERKLEAERKRKVRMAYRAKVLGAQLWNLFWLIIPVTLSTIMTLDYFQEAAPGLYTFGQILGMLCSLAYGLILLKASSEEEKYRTAGICCLISAAASFLLLLLPGGEEMPPWLFLIALPAAVVSLIGTYCEFSGHAAVTSDVDRDLSAKWSGLWKWYIGCIVAVFVCTFLAAAGMEMGIFLLICATLTLVAVAIGKLIYLYRTAKLFREYR